MGHPLRQLIETYVGAAKAASDPTPILRRAANDFAKMAMDPKNAQVGKKLNNVAMEFAAAAHRPATTSDFLDLMRETQAAIEQVGDGNAMDIIARRREIHDARSSDAPRVSISPESFNEDATLGRSAKIQWLRNLSSTEMNDAIAQGIVDSQTVLFWQGVKREAQAVTVDTGLVSTPPLSPAPVIVIGPPPLPLSIRLYGRIEYGADGNKTVAEFDLALGQRVTVPGNYVSLLVGADPPIAGAPTAPLIVGASMGTFAAASHAPVIRTRYVDALDGAGATTDYIPIPAKAVQLLSIQDNLALGEAATLAFFGFGGGGVGPVAISTVFYVKTANVQMPPIPITGDISYVVVQNNAAAARNFRLPFQLSL